MVKVRLRAGPLVSTRPQSPIELGDLRVQGPLVITPAAHLRHLRVLRLVGVALLGDLVK